jgi:hypothetical protein
LDTQPKSSTETNKSKQNTDERTQKSQRIRRETDRLENMAFGAFAVPADAVAEAEGVGEQRGKFWGEMKMKMMKLWAAA